MRRLPVLFVTCALLLLASSLQAYPVIYDIDNLPIAPTTNDAVTIRLTLVNGIWYELGSATRNGNVLTITASSPCVLSACEVIQLQTLDVPFGRLTAGIYQVNVNVDGNPGTYSFEVRHDYSPSGIYPPPRLTLLPAAPTEQQKTTLRVEIPRGPDEVILTGLLRNENTFTVELQSPCALCGNQSPSFVDVPLGFLPAGTYHVDIDFYREGTESLDFTVAAGDPANLFRVQTRPLAPTDADATSLLVSRAAAFCRPASFSGFRRQGQVVTVDFATPAEAPDCAADESRTATSQLVELGQLEPGAYQVVLRQDGVQVASHPFDVADAADTVTLLGRYRASIEWTTADGQKGQARPVAVRTSESAMFSFFNLGNWEVILKVLDGCAINGNRWVFLAAATDVQYTLTVEDLQGAEQPFVYTSPSGLATPPLTETAAFSCNP